MMNPLESVFFPPIEGEACFWEGLHSMCCLEVSTRPGHGVKIVPPADPNHYKPPEAEFRGMI